MCSTDCIRFVTFLSFSLFEKLRSINSNSTMWWQDSVFGFARFYLDKLTGI